MGMRCPWGDSDDLMRDYHDNRWGKPVHDDRELFAMLALEGQQAGLSWSLILKREAAYRAAFDGFDPQVIAAYDDARIEELLACDGLIHNRRKMLSVRTNAQAFLRVQQEFGSFDVYIWGFTDGCTIDHRLARQDDMPAFDDLSKRASRDMKKRGFTFVGPTIVYSYLQAIGVINDHILECPYR
ncbi:DNA-3-methyladenine glycosylase I [Slackia heliotrinireducens]|uniref:DNA-3-methyladenine glycosylase I n=1 Tax=Slackia heliotrinireducens TaxID=84110 RepID=UPI0033146F87